MIRIQDRTEGPEDNESGLDFRIHRCMSTTASYLEIIMLIAAMKNASSESL